jgi:hypothetical protein
MHFVLLIHLPAPTVARSKFWYSEPEISDGWGTANKSLTTPVMVDGGRPAAWARAL